MSNYLQEYTAITKPEILTASKTNYVIVDMDLLAESKEAFHAAVTLDILSNAIFKRMKELLRLQYKVFPLEGVWHLLDEEIGFSEPENIEGQMMIKQPLELTDDLFQEIKTKILQINEEAHLIEYIEASRLQLNEAQDVIQMLHIGPYTQEPATFTIMNEFASSQGRSKKDEDHREIYLKDVRHVIRDKFETILRMPCN